MNKLLLMLTVLLAGCVSTDNPYFISENEMIQRTGRATYLLSYEVDQTLSREDLTRHISFRARRACFKAGGSSIALVHIDIARKPSKSYVEAIFRCLKPRKGK